MTPPRPARCHSCLCQFLNPRCPRTACISMWPRPLKRTRRRWLLGWRGWARPPDRHRATRRRVVGGDGRSRGQRVLRGQPSRVGWQGPRVGVRRDRAGGRGRFRLHGRRGDRSVLGGGDWVAGARRGRSGVWLRDDRGGGPYLDLHRVSEPKTAKLRVHLDVAPFPNDDHSAESCVSALSAPSRATSAKATSTGSFLPTPRATSSPSSPLADREWRHWLPERQGSGWRPTAGEPWPGEPRLMRLQRGAVVLHYQTRR